jgi:hypothetical protein
MKIERFEDIEAWQLALDDSWRVPVFLKVCRQIYPAGRLID